MSASERYLFDPANWAVAIQELDAAFAGAWAPKIKAMVQSTRTYAYFGGPELQLDGSIDWFVDGTIVCPDDTLSLVQREPITGTVIVADPPVLQQGYRPMAVVRCTGGLLLRFVDARDAVLGKGARLLDDLEDVSLYDVADGDILKYDIGLGLWVNVPDTAGVDVEDESTPILTPASTLNFTGAGVSVTDAGGGVADVTIPGNTDPLDPGEPLPAALHRFAIVFPVMGSATITSIGRILTPTAVGSPGFGVAASGSSFQAGFHRPTRETTTAANQSAGWVAAAGNANYWRGDAAGRGGFKIVWRFSFEVLPSGTRFFIGLYATAADPCLGAEPSAAVNMVGLGKDTSDTDMQFMHNDGSGTATKVSLGAPAATAVVYELVLIGIAGGGDVIARLYSVIGTGSTLIQQSTLTTNLPATTAFMAPTQTINTSAGGSALTICFHGWTFDSL